jgi:hypothetical protein
MTSNVTIGDEFKSSFSGEQEVFKLIRIHKDGNATKKQTGAEYLIYTFVTLVNGERSKRPEFSMYKKWFIDLVERNIWKKINC